MQRPASRRAGRRSSPPPYGLGRYEPEGPYGPAEPYGPAGYYPPGEPYADGDPYEPEPYQPGRYERQPYEPGAYEPAPYQPGRYERDPYEPDSYQPERYEREPYEPGRHEPGRRRAGDGPGRRRQAGGGRARRRGRIRRFFRLRTVRIILAVIAVFLCWVGFSVGQALAAPGGGSTSSKLAEWARDHYLGPLVTLGEWMTYNPPKVGGQPGFSLAQPGSQGQARFKRTRGFIPNVPEKLTPFASPALPGEGQWRLLETVKGEPAMYGTFLRPDKVHTSYVAGIVSMDQRLVRFELRPGSEDPGPGNWKAQPWIPPGTRTGLIGTFNGGFKLDSAGGGFYLNGASRGNLINGAASVVYYRNGTISIGTWGREVTMTPDVVGVRQNLRLIIDHGRIPAAVNQDVLSSWGATLGGGYYVWRSGLGITKGGRVIFAYGPALDVQSLANLLKRAGAVEALQLDINPEWMSFDYYKAGGRPGDPTPHPLLPTQQGNIYRYYSVFSRDFTAVYAR